jgi:hypothetical protein
MPLLHRLEPDQVMFNVSLEATTEYEKWAALPEQIAAARERLLVVSADTHANASGTSPRSPR